MSHPHPSRRHILHTYRRHIMACKKAWGTARGLIHYRAFIAEYLAAKRDVLRGAS